MTWVLLLACASEGPAWPRLHADPEPTFASVPEAERRKPQGIALAGAFDRHVVSGPITELPAPIFASMDESETVLSQLGAHLEHCETGGGGEALEAAMDELPSRRVETYGLASLTLDQLFGDAFHPSLCETSQLFAPVEWEGDDWILDVGIPTFMVLQSSPVPELMQMPAACSDALLDAAGDLDAALEDGCVEDHYQAFLPEGSDCRACVEADGDFSRCVEEGACNEEEPAQVWFEGEDGEPVWYEMNWSYIWGCAPDWGVLSYQLSVPDDEPDPPPAFDHARWGYLCIPYWDEEAGAPDFTCVSGAGGPERGDALLEGLLGRINGIYREEEEPTGDWATLPFYADTVSFDGGNTLRWMWGFASGAGVVSLPPLEVDSDGDGVFGIGDDGYGSPGPSWGLNPYALRPDGTDPTRVDDTFARDWIATLALKVSTTRDGVPINTYNHSRCVEWEDLPDGRSRCVTQGEPVYGWHNDLMNGNFDAEMTIASPFPVTTLASPGTFDPDIPGGVVPEVWSSTTLADPDWDACSWPRTFAPDRARVEDEPSAFGGAASAWVDTWRFEAHPDEDFRMLLATNQARDYCPLDTE